MVTVTESPVPFSLREPKLMNESTSTEMWPSLGESLAGQKKKLSQTSWSPAQPANIEQQSVLVPDSSEDSWEMLTTFVPPTSPVKKFKEQRSRSQSVSINHNELANPKALVRCSSTPDLSAFEFISEEEEEDEQAASCSDMSSAILVDANTADDTRSILTTDSVFSMDTSHTSVWGSSSSSLTRKTSFKDMIMRNPQEELEEKVNQDVKPVVRKKFRPRLVVKPITRCIKSTGDLISLSQIQEEEESHGGGGGGGGAFGGISIEEDEAVGDSDAMEFYHRKNKGATGRVNGLKARPDEAKRKEIIIHRKEAQRKRQQDRDNASGTKKK
eukprot:scaffold5201_cov54-Attheya_sp.AAC.1